VIDETTNPVLRWRGVLCGQN